jgi:hypothetical protein
MEVVDDKRREYQRKYYAKNKEKIKAQMRKYYAENKEKVKEWIASNPDKVLDGRRRYAEKRRSEFKANPEKAAALYRKWYLNSWEKKRKSRSRWKKENPEKAAAHQQKYEIGTRYPPELVEVKLIQLKILAALRA